MNSFTVNTKQLKLLEKQLEKAGPDIIKKAQRELKQVANETLANAIDLAPVNDGVLKQNMAIEAVDENEYKIGNNKDYAAFVEFGTGVRTYIPKDFKKLAAKFKGKTDESWENGLEEIKKWCRNKGIPEEAAYPIFVTILNKGIYASPFLWPSFKFGRAELIVKIKALLKDLKK